MKDRIVQFLSAESISPAEFADKIGVQRSSMSHILNGRNHPSASFLQKMFQIYPDLNPRWLMIGDGAMNMGKEQPAPIHPMKTEPVVSRETIAPENDTEANRFLENSLFSTQGGGSAILGTREPVASTAKPENTFIQPESDPVAPSVHVSQENLFDASRPGQHSGSAPDLLHGKEIEQVLLFFKDKTFAVYKPS